MKIQQRRRRIYYKQNVVQDPYGFVLATVAVTCAALLVFILIWPKNNISTSLATRSLRSPAHSDMDSKDYIHQPGQMVKSKIRLPKSATRSGQRNVLKISVTPQTKVLKDSAKPQTSIFEDSIKPVTNIFKDSVKPQTSGTTKTIWM